MQHIRPLELGTVVSDVGPSGIECRLAGCRAAGCTAAGFQAAGCRGGSADSAGIARKAKTNEKQAKPTKTQEKGI